MMTVTAISNTIHMEDSRRIYIAHSKNKQHPRAG